MGTDIYAFVEYDEYSIRGQEIKTPYTPYDSINFAKYPCFRGSKD